VKKVKDMRHLCDECMFKFPICRACEMVWGCDLDDTATGEDADKVIQCDGFVPRRAVERRKQDRRHQGYFLIRS
jgi:hypothetical protein